nr:Os11g0158666 [Ipomoea batatas]
MERWVLIARSEGSFSRSLNSDLLAVGAVIGGVIDADAVAEGGGGGGGGGELLLLGGDVCAVLLFPLLGLAWIFSPSSSSSWASCWYISSTMGFHNRTLALMNQFDTWLRERPVCLAKRCLSASLGYGWRKCSKSHARRMLTERSGRPR